MSTLDNRFPDSNRNRFFSSGEPGERPKGRFYAAFEVAEPIENEERGEPVYLECAFADDVDGFVATEMEPGRFWNKVSLSVLALDDESLMYANIGNSEPGDVVWFEVLVSPATVGEENGMQYGQLLDAGERVHIRLGKFRGSTSQGSPIPPHYWLKGNPDAELNPKLLGGYSSLKSAGVAVFDVGQGASQALMYEECGHFSPMLYVDVGGGVLQNLSTFPKNFKGFCPHDVPIILSHWDWDHWSSVCRFPNLLDSDWIAPLPPPKPIQQSLSWILQGLGRLSLWVPGMPPKYRTKSMLLELCTGKTTNDSGIAVTLFGGAWGTKRCLLPGDAGYRYIPSVVANERFNALSITHHGGRLHSKQIPIPKRGARAMCSVGSGNSYKHPFWETIDAHHDGGWPTPISTGYYGRGSVALRPRVRICVQS
jgi:hypothetical protein